jgi:hypothetical protein
VAAVTDHSGMEESEGYDALVVALNPTVFAPGLQG